MTLKASTASAIIAEFLGKQNVVAIPIILVRLTGAYTAAAFLAQAIYWHHRTNSPDGFFWKTHPEWDEELALSPKQIRKCVEACGGIVEVERRGIPAKNYYRVNMPLFLERISALVEENNKMLPKGTSEDSQLLPKVTSSSDQRAQQVARNRAHLVTEITSETTFREEEGTPPVDNFPPPAERSSSFLEQAPLEQQAAYAAGAIAPSLASESEAEQASRKVGTSGTSSPRGESSAPRRAEIRDLLGRLYAAAAFEETPDKIERDEWRDITPERVYELKVEAQQAATLTLADGTRVKFPTALIQLLDREIGSSVPLKWHENGTVAGQGGSADKALDAKTVDSLRVASKAKPEPRVGLFCKLDGILYEVKGQLTESRWRLVGVKDPVDERDVTIGTWHTPAVKIVRP